MDTASNPLAPPRDLGLLAEFSAAFRLTRQPQARAEVAVLARAFAQLPYENLTKIIRRGQTARVDQARRGPARVLADHLAFGTGGTCFALSATLLHLVRASGLQAETILADRRYGADTHCALLVWIDGQPHLVDPGYLIFEPVAMTGADEIRVPTAFNELRLRRVDARPRVELHTAQAAGGSAYRLTYKTSPVDDAQFLRAWDASFDWDMMRYPLLTRLAAGEQLYLQDCHFQRRGTEIVQRMELTIEERPRRIAETFGIDAQIVHRALKELKRQGEPGGRTAARRTR